MSWSKGQPGKARGCYTRRSYSPILYRQPSLSVKRMAAKCLRRTRVRMHTCILLASLPPTSFSYPGVEVAWGWLWPVVPCRSPQSPCSASPSAVVFTRVLFASRCSAKLAARGRVPGGESHPEPPAPANKVPDARARVSVMPTSASCLSSPGRLTLFVRPSRATCYTPDHQGSAGHDDGALCPSPSAALHPHPPACPPIERVSFKYCTATCHISLGAGRGSTRYTRACIDANLALPLLLLHRRLRAVINRGGTSDKSLCSQARQRFPGPSVSSLHIGWPKRVG